MHIGQNLETAEKIEERGEIAEMSIKHFQVIHTAPNNESYSDY